MQMSRKRTATLIAEQDGDGSADDADDAGELADG
jgi:hypothetical protein